MRLACRRHLDDLANGHLRGLHFDWPAARRAISFFPDCLSVTRDGIVVAFDLHPAQQFIVGCIFGWKTADGWRRFRTAYIEIAKGNGKSPLAAGIALYMLVADKEHRAEIYSAAVDKDQAKILFRDAVAMLDSSPELNARIQRSGGMGREYNLAYLKTSSFFKPIASESTGRGKSGPRPHCAILDEVHEHPTNAMVEFMRAGTKGRRQALVLMITNSGVIDPTQVCFQYHQFSERLMKGIETNDHFFAYVCGLDLPQAADPVAGTEATTGDDWADPNVWRKANPLLGVSITVKYLEEQVHDALGMPSKESLVRRLNFCEWVGSAAPLVDPKIWAANGGPVDRAALRGCSCVGGIDLSGKNDLTAITLLFDPDVLGKRRVLQFFWTPEANIKERSRRDKVEYERWVTDGLITATPGKVIDYDFVAGEIGNLISEFDVKAFAFDPWNIERLEKAIENEGIGGVGESDLNLVRLVRHDQGFHHMNASISVLEDYLLEHTVRHGDNVVLTWCVGNVKVETNNDKLRKFSKSQSTGRIDGAQSLCMAAGLSVSFGGSDGGSYAYTQIL